MICKSYKLLLLRALSLAAGLILLLLPFKAAAHGVQISSAMVNGIEITALYDSGQPMAGGQVNVYAPDDPLEPWLTGVCDDQGKFFFIPDYSKPGLWEVQVRLAGHGDLVRIEITGSEEAIVTGTTGLSSLQKAVMALTVIWGAVGTALFFSRRRT
jgi:nickel transport protein